MLYNMSLKAMILDAKICTDPSPALEKRRLDILYKYRRKCIRRVLRLLLIIKHPLSCLPCNKRIRPSPYDAQEERQLASK